MIRLYFYGPPTAKRALHDAYDAIKSVCRRADVQLSTNTEREGINLPPETIAAHEVTAAPLLDAMQALIVEGSIADPQAGYLLAYAMAQKRPLLYLYSRGEVAPDVLRYLNLKELPKYIQVLTYTPASLEGLVEQFLTSVGHIKIREVPNIKFTLRLTQTIDDYLEFKTRNTKLTKADYLRQHIEKLIEDDQAFQQYLRRRRS